MTVSEADQLLARLQREGASRDRIDDARDARDAAVRRAVGSKALRRLERGIERCVAAGDAEVPQ